LIKYLALAIVIATLTVGSIISLQDAFAQHPAFHGKKTAAGFHVEITVEPIPIEPGVLTKFGTEFLDATTGELAEEVPHTFVLMKDEVIFKEFTTSASHIHEFRFVEEHEGSLTVLIEDVNNSGENVEFSLTVVPEFPLSATLAMGAVLATMFVILGFKGFYGKRL
jgi:hypothetical protein